MPVTGATIQAETRPAFLVVSETFSLNPSAVTSAIKACRFLNAAQLYLAALLGRAVACWARQSAHSSGPYALEHVYVCCAAGRRLLSLS